MEVLTELQYIKKNIYVVDICNRVRASADFDQFICKLLQDASFQAVDEYFDSNGNTAEFYNILAHILYMFYIKKINDDRFQTLLRIQQVRWMTCIDNKNAQLVQASTMCIFRDIPCKKTIISQVSELIKGKLYKQISVERLKRYLSRILDGTVWYKLELNYIPGSWHGFGQDNKYFPIPSSLNFTSISCIYKPRLIFGTMSESTLTQYILHNMERPYSAHFPGSKSNLVNIHGRENMIMANWMHDFHHSSSSRDCKDGFKSTIRYLNNFCLPIPYPPIENMDDPRVMSCLKKQPEQAGALNDTGSLLHELYNDDIWAEESSAKNSEDVSSEESSDVSSEDIQ